MPTTGASRGSGQVIFDEVAMSGDDTGDWFLTPVKKRGQDEVVVQIDISVGQADVMIEGRLSEDAQPIPMLQAVVDEVTTLTIAGLTAFAYVPQLRVVVTGTGATPTVRVELFHG